MVTVRTGWKQIRWERSNRVVSVSTAMKAEISLGEHLRRLRTARGISLSALARAAGVAQPTLTRWEQGRFAPRLPELDAVLTALNASSKQRRSILESLDAPRALARLADENPLEDGAGWRAAAGIRPVRGDLLRALRRRAGRTLEDVAQSVGVSAATVSRWERSETWPDAAQLHMLCYALNAQEAEIVALTRGRMLSFETGQSDALDSEAIGAQLDALQNDISSPSGLQDLRYLALEAALWPHLGRDATALPFLYLTVSSRAGYLMAWNRYAESGAAARRAFDIEALLPTTARRTFLSADPYRRNFGSFYYYNVINYAVVLLQSSNPALWRQARRLLLEEKARCDRPEFQAWMLSIAAASLEKEGHIEAALAMCVQSCDIAHAFRPEAHAERSVEYANRRIDYSQLLTRAGAHGQALKTLESAIPLLGMDHESPRLVLLEVECLIGLNRRSEAHDRAIQAEVLLQVESLPRLQQKLSALRAQL
jgi:transcriptional regulator with XRE-family HTH domain